MTARQLIIALLDVPDLDMLVCVQEFNDPVPHHIANVMPDDVGNTGICTLRMGVRLRPTEVGYPMQKRRKALP